jgi:protein TonB
VALHAVLAVLLVTSPSLFPNLGDVTWGSEAGGGGGISVQLVAADFTGIPLPAPAVVSPEAVGNDSPGFYEPVPTPEAAPPEEDLTEAEPIPETFEPPAVEAPRPEPAAAPEAAPPEPGATAPPAPTPPSPPREERPPVPDNAVPFGQGGQLDISGGFSTGQGTGSVDIGDGAFGQQHSTYVRAMTQRISQNWFQSMVNLAVPSGRRVTLTFDILRDGRIQNTRIVESSGDSTLDTSAERAIQRSSPLQPLPLAFRGNQVSVRFWFEFQR